MKRKKSDYQSLQTNDTDFNDITFLRFTVLKNNASAFKASDLCLNKTQTIQICYYKNYNLSVINFDFTNAINISIQTSDADLTLTFES